MAYKIIKNLEQLKQLASGESPVECFVWVGSFFRSSKRILYNANGGAETWWIENEIDNSEENFSTDEDMLSKSGIGVAIEKGCLYQY